MKVHHIGYLVDNIESGEKEFLRIGFSRSGKIVQDSSRGIYILFLENGGYVVELIQSVDETSSVYKLHKKAGNSPYHICYETEDLSGEIAHMLDEKGWYLLQPPQPAPAIQGCPQVAFLMNRHIGIIEFVETKSSNK